MNPSPHTGLGAAGGNNLVDGEHEEQRMFELKCTPVMWGLGDLSCGWNMPPGGWASDNWGAHSI